MRRLGRWVRRTLAGVLLLVVLAALGAIAYLRSPSGGERVLAEIETAIAQVGGRFAAEGVRVRSLRRVELEDVRLSFGRRSRVRAARATIVWAPLALAWGEVRIRRVVLESPRVRLVERNGGWGFEDWDDDADDGMSGPRIRVRTLEVVRGRIGIGWEDGTEPVRVVLRDVDGEAGLDVTASGVEIDVRSLRVRPAGRRLGTLALRGTVDVSEPGTRIDAQVAVGESTFALATMFGADGDLDARVVLPRLARHDLARVAPALPVPDDVAGSIDVRGPRAALVTTISLDAGPGVRLRAEGTLDTTVWPPRGTLALDGSALDVAGLGRVDAETLQVRRDASDEDALVARGVLGVRGGRVAIDGRSARSGAGAVEVRTTFDVGDTSPWTGFVGAVRGTASFADGVLATRMTGTDPDGRRAVVDARVGDLGPAWRADVSIDAADPSFGSVVARGHVRAASPGILADVQSLEVKTVRDESPWRLTATARVRWDGSSVATDGLALVRRSGRVVVGGRVVPGRSADALEVDVRVLGMDVAELREWFPSGVERIDGQVEASAEIRGPLDAPRVDGEGQLTATRVDVTGLGRFDALRLHVRARTGEAVVIDTLEARKGEGIVTGSGTIGLAAGGDAPLTGELRLRRMVVARRPLYRAVVGGRVTVSGTIDAPRIDAALRIPSGVVRPRLLPEERAADRDPTITVVGEPEAPKDKTAAEALAPVAIHAVVTLGDEVFLRRKDADIRLAGVLEMDKAVASPFVLGGAIELAEGWYSFRERRFDVRSGTIRFTGGPTPDPELNIRARHRAPGYVVWVDVGGVASAPTLSLSSDPSLSEADVLAVLLFGRPASDLREDEQGAVQREAQSVALSYVAPALAASARRVLPVDRVEVRGDELMVARSVTQDVFISLAQELTAGGGQIVGLEYDVTPRTSIKLSTSTRGSSAIDFFWRRRY